MNTYGRNLSYGRYMAGKEMSCANIDNIPIKAGSLIMLLECNRKRSAREMVDDILKMKEACSSVVKILYEDIALAPSVYSKLYTNPPVDTSKLYDEYLEILKSEVDEIEEVLTGFDLHCMAVVNVSSILSDRFTVYKGEPGWRETVDLFNTLVMCGMSKRYKESMFKFEDDLDSDDQSGGKGSDTETNRDAVRDEELHCSDMETEVSTVCNRPRDKYSSAKQLYALCKGQWWNLLGDKGEESDGGIGVATILDLVVRSMKECLNPDDKDHALEDVIGVIKYSMVQIALNCIRDQNEHTATLVEMVNSQDFMRINMTKLKVVSCSWKESVFVEYTDTSAVSKFYDSTFRESLRLFVALDWILDAETISVEFLENILDALTMLPIIAYEMIPVVAKVLYCYFVSQPKIFEWGRLNCVNLKLHCGDTLLSLILYGSQSCHSKYDRDTMRALVRSRVNTLMTKTGCIEYTMKYTILGEKNVLSNLVDLYMAHNPFVRDTLDLIYQNCSKETITKLHTSDDLDITALTKCLADFKSRYREVSLARGSKDVKRHDAKTQTSSHDDEESSKDHSVSDT